MNIPNSSCSVTGTPNQRNAQAQDIHWRPVKRDSAQISTCINRTDALILRSPSHQWHRNYICLLNCLYTDHGSGSVPVGPRSHRVGCHRPHHSLPASTTFARAHKHHHCSIGVPQSQPHDPGLIEYSASASCIVRLRLNVGRRPLQTDTLSVSLELAVWLVIRHAATLPVPARL